jgi:hypothetical protein
LEREGGIDADREYNGGRVCDVLTLFLNTPSGISKKIRLEWNCMVQTTSGLY